MPGMRQPGMRSLRSCAPAAHVARVHALQHLSYLDARADARYPLIIPSCELFATRDGTHSCRAQAICKSFAFAFGWLVVAVAARSGACDQTAARGALTRVVCEALSGTSH